MGVLDRFCGQKCPKQWVSFKNELWFNEWMRLSMVKSWFVLDVFLLKEEEKSMLSNKTIGFDISYLNSDPLHSQFSDSKRWISNFEYIQLINCRTHQSKVHPH